MIMEQTVFTLEEYEAQRKAKMSSLIGKKEARAVEEIQGEKIEKIEGDYFAVRYNMYLYNKLG